MAQTTVDLDSKVLLESGFLPLDDLTTERDRQVLDDKRFRTAVKAFFGPKKCVLAHWLRYGNRPGFVECHVKGGPKAGRLALMVHVLARGSRVDYYRGSHIHELRTIEGQRGLYEVDALEVADLEPWVAGDERLTEGGKVVLDGRLRFQIAQLYTITFIYPHP
ncbi:hypothetical protein GGR55DRAFT_691098 [Xylaria sp. FL0064]|nr:hypothetical protein GGR55DRAFT_691098 [Xylaria sp. FL0064]